MRAQPLILKALSSGALACVLAGCSTPEVDDVTWQCTQEADCGSGYVCERTAGLCRPADGAGRNGIFDDEVRLGVVLPLSKGPTDAALAWQAGLKAAFEPINRRGGIHGRQISLEVRDDAHQPETALAVLSELTSRRQVLAVLGGFGNHVTQVVGRDLQDRGVAFVTRSGGDEGRQVPAARYLFAVSAGDATEIGALVAGLVVDDVHLSNVAVLLQATPNGEAPDAQGQSVQDALRAAGIAAPGEGLVASGGDVTPAVDSIRAWMAAPERVASEDGRVRTAVILTTEAATAARFLRDLSASPPLDGLAQPRFLATGAPGASALAAALADLEPALDPACGTGVRFALGVPSWLATTPTARDYRAALPAGAEPGDVSFEGYLTGRLIIAALEAQGREITGESFVDTLQETAVAHGGGFTPERHHAIRAVAGATLTPTCELELD